MTRKIVSMLGGVLALATTCVQAADLVPVSRYSEVRFSSVGMGLAGDPYLDVETDLTATYDGGHQGEGWYVEPGGATDTGAWNITQLSTIEPGRTFYPAETYHQDYMTRHPRDPYIMVNDLPKVADLERLFPERYRSEPVLVRGS